MERGGRAEGSSSARVGEEEWETVSCGIIFPSHFSRTHRHLPRHIHISPPAHRHFPGLPLNHVSFPHSQACVRMIKSMYFLL